MDFDAYIKPPERFWRKGKRWQIIAIIVILAALVRIWAAWQLPVDADEPTYSRAGQAYAAALKAWNLQDVINYSENKEHPPLVKLIYSVPYLFVEPRFGSNIELIINRLISVLFGVLAVWLLANIDPLAGFFLAMDSMTIKYTSEVYLEALPLFAVIFSIYLLKNFKTNQDQKLYWFGSAAFLGAAVAGKYLYGLGIFPLLALIVQARYFNLKLLAGYAVTTFAVFFALNPYLWVDPINRLWDSLFFHLNYSQGSDVLRASYPWFQPVNWIKMSVPWHAKVFFFPTMDVPVFFLAIAGLWPAVRKNAWVVIWAIACLVTLLFWPTKWPQYVLVLKPALCLLAAYGFYFLLEKALNFEATWHWAENVLPHPTRLFWIALVVFCLATTVVYVSYQVNLAAARSGWTEILTEYSPLPSNNTFDIASLSDGRIAIGTDNGLAIWQPSNTSPWGESPLHLTPVNSPLPGWIIYSILPFQNGAVFASEAGITVWDGTENWKTVSTNDLGIPKSRINSLASGGKQEIWLATSTGVVWVDIVSGNNKVFTKENSGLPDNSIFSIAIQPNQATWFGSLKGVTRYDLLSSECKTFELSQFGTTWGGVVDLMVDNNGKVAAGTLGAGLNIWNGGEWQNYRISNSGIPQNNVNRIVQDGANNYWLGLSYSTTPGGLVVLYDNRSWRIFGTDNSGYSGHEAAGLTFDKFGRLWISTTVNGLQVFQSPPK